MAQGAVFLRCRSCGLWRQDPRPVATDALARYDDEYLAYEIARQFDYRAISLLSLAEAGLVPDAPPAWATRSDGSPPAVLDVGCATGALLSSFAAAGWKAVGVEPGASMAAHARDRFGLDVRAATLEAAGLPSASFDAVTALHVIEHLNDPVGFLRAVRGLLRPSGRLFLMTPNADGFQAVLRGGRWRSAIRDHLYLFSVRTMSAMLAAAGFRVEYAGTWGGWPVGERPRWLKAPLDAAAKKLGLGDVMILRAGPAGTAGV